MSIKKHLYISISMRNHSPSHNIVMKKIIFRTCNIMIFVLVNSNVFYLDKSMDLELPKSSFCIDSLMKNYSLFFRRICLCMDFSIDIISDHLYVIFTNIINNVLFKRPLNILVNTLEKVTMTKHEIVSQFRKDKFVIKISFFYFGMSLGFIVKRCYVKS